jgi:hypothetical protein
MSTIAVDEMHPLKTAGRLFPRNPNFRTILRWIRIGAKTKDQRTVKLEATLCVGRYYVTAEQAERFIREQQPLAGRRNR